MRIQGPGELDQVLGVVLAPGLVEDDPEDDGGMIEPLTNPLRGLHCKLGLEQATLGLMPEYRCEK